MVSISYMVLYRWFLYFVALNSIFTLKVSLGACNPKCTGMRDEGCCICRPYSWEHPCRSDEIPDLSLHNFPRCCYYKSSVIELFRGRPRSTNREIAISGRSATPTVNNQWEKSMDTEPRVPQFRTAERPPGQPFSGRVSFGTIPVPGGHPYLVSVRRIRRRAGTRIISEHHCGGTLIHPNWVVSAAHCFLDGRRLGAEDIVVRVGEYDMSIQEGREQDYFVNAIRIPPTFNTMSFEDDISLLYIEPGVRIIPREIDVAALPTENTRVTSNTRCYIAGWGQTQDGKTSIVMEAKLQYLDPAGQAYCNRIFRRQRAVSRSMFCAGSTTSDAVDACHGDSGGPFVCEINGQRTLIGIPSWGVRRCGLRSRSPGVYSDVRVLRQWIRNNAGL